MKVAWGTRVGRILRRVGGSRRAKCVVGTAFALVVTLVTVVLFVRGGGDADADEAPVAALGITAPNTPPDLAGLTVGEHTVLAAGTDRSYRSLVPAADTGPTTSARLPLVIVLSGRGEGGWTAARSTGFLPLARRGQAALVFPEGVSRSWNAGIGCCGAAGRSQLADTAFVDAVRSDALSVLPVDPTRVYLVGYSNGGKLAYTVACTDPRSYAGVATYGAVPLAPCRTAAPLPFVLAAGVRDAILPFRGAPRAKPPTASVRAAAVELSARDRCTPVPISSRTGPATVERWTGCASATGVELLVYPFADHAWPPSAAGLMWAYLTGFPAASAAAPATRSPAPPPEHA